MTDNVSFFCIIVSFSRLSCSLQSAEYLFCSTGERRTEGVVSQELIGSLPGRSLSSLVQSQAEAGTEGIRLLPLRCPS